MQPIIHPTPSRPTPEGLALPTTKTPALRRDPRILVLYGAPKVGKTTKLAELSDCLIIDNEHGTDYIECLKISINNIEELRDVSSKLHKNPMQFRYIALDTVTTLEDWAEELATYNYKHSPVGKNYEGKSVLTLSDGRGYFWLRQAFKELLVLFSGTTSTLILVAHLREKQFEKSGNQVLSKDIELTGKVRTITCSLADTVGYIYRHPTNHKLMLSFAGTEDVICGSRCDHLKGQIIEFDWSKIFVESSRKTPAPLIETHPSIV